MVNVILDQERHNIYDLLDEIVIFQLWIIFNIDLLFKLVTWHIQG